MSERVPLTLTTFVVSIELAIDHVALHMCQFSQYLFVSCKYDYFTLEWAVSVLRYVVSCDWCSFYKYVKISVADSSVGWGHGGERQCTPKFPILPVISIPSQASRCCSSRHGFGMEARTPY